MALFNKSDLPALLKRIQTKASFAPGELDEILPQIAQHPDFSVESCHWLMTLPNRKIRDWAAEQALLTRSPRLADQLLQEMPGQNEEVRTEIATVVGKIAPSRLPAYLGRMIHSRKPEGRLVALDLIAAQERLLEYVGYLKAALKDPEPKVRHRAVRILAQEPGDQTVFLILRALVNDEDAKVRHIVIDALASRPNPDVVEPFFERLPLESHQTQGVIMRALKQLAASGNAKIETRLLPVLADENPRLRDIAVQLLREVPDPGRVLRAFLVHCKGLAHWLRERSMQSIAKISDDLVSHLTALMQDEDPDIQVGAMVMASRSTDRRIRPYVQRMFLSDGDWWIRSLAAEILGNFSDDTVTEILMTRLADPELRYTVISVLGRHQNEMALGALLSCLNDQERGIRMTALEALSANKDPRALAALQHACHDPDAMVRQKASDILKQPQSGATKVNQPTVEAPPDLHMENEALNIPAPS